MKKVITFLLIAVSYYANATNYYVSSTGNDVANGLTTGTAWKTTSKVNSFAFATNDSILFKRGDVFYGAIVVARSDLKYSAYGTGAKPVISGLTTVSGWALVSSGIYQATLNAKSPLNFVTLNGQPQMIARYPNSNYLSYEAYSGLSSITDNELPGTPNYTGAEVVIRKSQWNIDRNVITNHTGGTIGYRQGRTQINNYGATKYMPFGNNYGYFLQNDSRFLDVLGEWVFDSVANKLQVYFGGVDPTSVVVKASTIDTLVRVGAYSNISISNINFEGAGLSAIYAVGGSGINISNCDINGAGAKGIQMRTVSNVTITGNTVNWCLSNAIQVLSSTLSDVTIVNNTIKNTAQYEGMLSNFDGTDGKAIVAITNNLNITYNRIDTTGYSGIDFNGNNVLVSNNTVNYFCNKMDDGAAYYTWRGGTDDAPAARYFNRTLSNNIAFNGIGAPDGTAGGKAAAHGFYNDGMANCVTVTGNTFYDCSGGGITLNNPDSIVIRNNSIYNCSAGIRFTRWPWGSINNLIINRNIIFGTNENQLALFYANNGVNSPVATTFQEALRSVGSIDSNYYSGQNELPFGFDQYANTGGANVKTSPQSMQSWQAFSLFDQHSTVLAKFPSYLLNTILTANLAKGGGLFNTSIVGYTAFGSGTTGAWDNTSKISGTGSYRLSFGSPAANTYSIIHSAVGPVSSAKKYLLRFSTLGSTNAGIVKAYIRRTASPYNQLVTEQVRSFGTSRINHEILFTAPETVSAASIVLAIDQNGGTAFIDNVEFYEVSATLINITDKFRFEVNPGFSSVDYSIPGRFKDLYGSSYTDTINLSANSSSILLPDAMLASNYKKVSVNFYPIKK